MHRGEARFIAAAARAEDLPAPVGREVAFAGRSNVGKSSLINAVVGRRGLARVSRTPGRTQQINFFDVEGLGILVDLPGYGYARAPAAVRAAWKPLVDGYLVARRPLALLLLLVDARHIPSDSDVAMMTWLNRSTLNSRVVLTKADAVPRSKMKKTMQEAAERLEIAEPSSLLAVSARTGTGMRELWALIHQSVSR